jgi:hypothetical protein
MRTSYDHSRKSHEAGLGREIGRNGQSADAVTLFNSANSLVDLSVLRRSEQAVVAN